jgi:dolichol-phosphate mannosyltransferase
MIFIIILEMKLPDLSLIIPCHNEEPNLIVVADLLKSRFDSKIGQEWEVIFVDDGSADGTAAIISELNKRDGRFKGVFLSRNFGHQMALTAGLGYATGSAVGIIDCDLQDPVDVLLDMYDMVAGNDCDVAYGIRRKRHAPWLLTICYKLFYRILAMASDVRIPKDSGDFCVMNARAHELIKELPEKQRFLRGLRAWIGLRQTGLPYDRPQRLAGHSKYNFFHLLRLAFSGITAFSLLPLRFASMLGFFFSATAVVLALALLLNRLIPSWMPFGYYIGANPGTTTLALLILGAFAALFLCLGIIGEYIALLVIEVKGRPTAIVDRALGFGNEPPKDQG